MEFLSCLVVESIKGLFVPLKRQICYLRNYDKNIVNLKNEANRLSRMGTDVQNKVVEARGRLEEINEVVAKWLDDVDAIGVKMTSLEKRVNENKRCFKGLCPDWRSRRQISKQAVKMLLLVNDLQAKGTFSTVSHVPPPPSVEPVRTDCVVGLRSRDLVMNRVMDALRDEHIRTIGLYGMGGIGKTTVVNELNNKPEVSQLFKKVIMVVVSNSPDFQRIQYQIGERLGLKLESDSAPQVRSNKLLKRLQDEESVLIIFDDVWMTFEVADVIGILTGDEHLGCKIIITTRIHDVCRGMKIQSAIKVEPLFEDESWVLFKAKAGDVVTRTTLAPLAEKIVRKCQGAPLAIVTLGSTLRDVEEEFEWENALRALENPAPIELEGIIPEVIRSLRYSYDHLKGTEIKLCFLFFCLFPEDYDILLFVIRDYGIGEGFLNVDGSLKEASNKLYTYVSRLKACGLLTDHRWGTGYVQMHDVVRDVAISIASDEDNGFWAKAGVRLRKWPDTEILNQYKRISFMDSEGIELQSPLECPQLRTLLLNENENLEINQDNFFERVKALAVLDLSSTSLNSIPKSLVYLTNLRTLYLRDLQNDLINISVLGGLKNLEILRMSGSSIKSLPEEIGNLTNLRCLDLTETRWLSRVAPNVLSRLTKLEELLMLGSFKKWDMEEECSSSSVGQKNASFAEVASLANLVELQIKLTTEGVASAEISCSWKNLNSYLVSIAPMEEDCFWSGKFGEQRAFQICKGNPIRESQLFTPKVLFERATSLILESCYGFNSVTDLDAVRGGSSHLEVLVIHRCEEIEYLIRIDEETPQDSFICPKELIIKEMGNMKKIVHGLSFPKTFGNLEGLDITECNKLKSLFSFRLARYLQRLSRLLVWNCKELVEIITIEDDEEEEAEDHQEGLLPQLKSVTLFGLNCLTSICRGSFLQHCPVKDFEVFDCPNLNRPLFRSKLEGSGVK